MENTVTVSSAPPTSHLLPLAIRGLEAMYDSEKRLFCHRLQKTPMGLVREGISHRYTIMTLLGLLRAEAAGLRQPFDIEATLDRLLDDTTWLDNVGDLGLLLWLCVNTSQKHLKQFHATFDLSGALERYPDARHRLTMELSWFLTGLVQACKVEQRGDLVPLAKEIYRLVLANQGQPGLFGHMAKWHSLAGVVRGRVGSFADQVYPILALAHFSQLFNDRAARDNALRCADAICARQGPLGQWWWHYDSVTGRVVDEYPVYSVHQHGMAPMALIALQEKCGADFHRSITKGLGWINGANELRQDLEDIDAGLVWRCIQLPKLISFAARIRALTPKDGTRGLHTLYECRPYELGWLLYALA